MVFLSRALITLVVSFILLSSVSSAATTNVIGSYDGWDTVSWRRIAGINDRNNAADRTAADIDFVGDATNWGGYWDFNDTHVYFRMRVAEGDLGTNPQNGSMFLIINVIGQNMNIDSKLLEYGPLDDPDDGMADYAFGWDSKSKPDALDMMVRNAAGDPAWSSFRFDRIAGTEQNPTTDINGDIDGRGWDGFVQTSDIIDDGSTDSETLAALSTTNFGYTSFIDIAVTWDYLETNTGLKPGQDWKVTFGSIAMATSENAIGTDVAGGVNPDALATEGFSDVVPEPATMSLLAIGGIAMLRRRRKK
jgi:hypothetical protein